MHLRPFLPADHGEIAAFTARANWGDQFVDIVFPGRSEHPRDLEQQFVRRLKAYECQAGTMTLVAETDPGDVGPDGQAVDEEGGKVVGSMTVQRLGTGIVADRWRSVRPERWVEGRLLALESWYVEVFGLNRAIDLAAQKRHYGRLAALKRTALEEERLKEKWEVINLCVDDRYQRRGVAKMLMEWILRQALSEGVPVGLRSSQAGKKLYKSLGFKNLGDFKWVEEGKEVNQAWMAWFPLTTST